MERTRNCPECGRFFKKGKWLEHYHGPCPVGKKYFEKQEAERKAFPARKGFKVGPVNPIM